MKSRWWFLALGALVIIGFWKVTLPVRKMDSQLYGVWRVANSQDAIRFKPDGKLEFLTDDKGSSLRFQLPTEWWTDQQNGLHVFQPDEDASGWGETTYKIEGNRLNLKDPIIPCIRANQLSKS